MNTRPSWGWFVALLGGLAGTGACGNYRGPVDLPTEGAVVPAQVPLDLAWEWPLVVYSGGSPAPMGVATATAACAPASACKALIEQPFVTNDDPKLVVVGLHPGAGSVDLQYVHPKRGEDMSAKLQFVFLPNEQLDTVDIGSPIPAAAFLFPSEPDQAKPGKAVADAPAAGMPARSTLLRCEADRFSGERHFLCFPLEDYGDGLQRYPSCRYSTRCSIRPSGILVNGFELCLAVSDGRVTGAAMFQGGTASAPVHVWGAFASCDAT